MALYTFYTRVWAQSYTFSTRVLVQSYTFSAIFKGAICFFSKKCVIRKQKKPQLAVVFRALLRMFSTFKRVMNFTLLGLWNEHANIPQLVDLTVVEQFDLVKKNSCPYLLEIRPSYRIIFSISRCWYLLEITPSSIKILSISSCSFQRSTVLWFSNIITFTWLRSYFAA